jgi:hypothetical protein
VRDRVRVLHYSIRTEDAYVQWIRRFILFHGKRRPQEMGTPELEAFLTDLAVDRDVAAESPGTQPKPLRWPGGWLGCVRPETEEPVHPAPGSCGDSAIASGNGSRYQ